MKTVSCPYCEKESEVKKNGKYVCPNEDCGEEFEIDFFGSTKKSA